jgi:hypothetical protein
MLTLPRLSAGAHLLNLGVGDADHAVGLDDDHGVLPARLALFTSSGSLKHLLLMMTASINGPRNKSDTRE